MSGWEPVDTAEEPAQVAPEVAVAPAPAPEPVAAPAPYAAPLVQSQWSEPEPQVVPAALPVGAQVAIVVSFVVIAYARLVVVADAIDDGAPWRVGVRIIAEAVALLAVPAALLFSGIFSTRLPDGPRAALVAVGAALLVWPGAAWF